MKKNVSEVVESAQEAFWAAVASHYPMVRTGDLAPNNQVRFDQECDQLVRQWLQTNLPEGAELRTEDGYTLRKVGSTFTDGDMVIESLVDLDVDFTVLAGEDQK